MKDLSIPRVHLEQNVNQVSNSETAGTFQVKRSPVYTTNIEGKLKIYFETKTDVYRDRFGIHVSTCPRAHVPMNKTHVQTMVAQNADTLNLGTEQNILRSAC